MFEDAFYKLQLDDTARILAETESAFEGVSFDPLETTIMAANVGFYRGYKLLEISNDAVMPSIKRYIIYSPQYWRLLDYTNQTIYDLNEKIPLELDTPNIGDYIRFFFHFVKGRHGHFHIVESVDDVRWKEDPPPQARKAVGSMIEPITLKMIGKGSEEGIFFCVVHVMFKNALFKMDVNVDPKGFVTITNEELLIDDMPILDDVLGQ